ncbi:MAG: nucleotidyltransferase family protein [Candidatus Vogelbacteria bacterium]|nr:nucleotidyltransferase family protein [Candidatus Vogelbacteria bacterium]
MSEDNLLTIKKAITPVLLKYGIKSAGVFGSRARGDSRPDSDIDILIELGQPMVFFAFGNLEDELEKILKYKVDLVTKDALHNKIKSRVIKDLHLIL